MTRTSDNDYWGYLSERHHELCTVYILVYNLHIARQTCQSQGVNIFAYDVPFFRSEVLSLISFTLRDRYDWGDINHYTVHRIDQAIYCHITMARDTPHVIL